MQIQIPTPQWLEPFLAPARYKGARGGRGSGKSHAFAELLVERCLVSPTRAVGIRERQNSIADSVKALIEDKIKAHNLGAYWQCLDHETRCTRTDSRILYRGMNAHNADAIKSLEGADVVLCDEAQQLGAKSIEVLVPTVRKPESELWFVWNPSRPDDPIERLLCGAKPPTGTIVRNVNWMDNPWFPEVLNRERLDMLERDPIAYAHVWGGGYKMVSEGLVFKRWQCAPFETPANAHFRFGADWGFAQDPTTLVRAWLGRFEGGVAIPDDAGRHLFVDWEAHGQGCEVDKTPDLFDTVPGSRQWVITADSSRPETISYMRRNGYPKIASAVKGPGSVEDGIEWLGSYDLVVHPRCEHVLHELAQYAWAVDAHSGLPTNKLVDKDNHMIDALRYAFEGVRRAVAARKRERDTQTVVPIPIRYNR